MTEQPTTPLPWNARPTSSDGFTTYGTIEPGSLRFTPEPDDVDLTQPTIVIPDRPWMSVEFKVTGRAAREFQFVLTGMPFFFDWTRALPPAPERRALPWGDSAYTSTVFERDPDFAGIRLTWAMGPLTHRDDSLTPSSEGPRRQEEAEGRQFGRWLDQHEATIRRRRRWPLGIDPDAHWYIPTHTRGGDRG